MPGRRLLPVLLVLSVQRLTRQAVTAVIWAAHAVTTGAGQQSHPAVKLPCLSCKVTTIFFFSQSLGVVFRPHQQSVTAETRMLTFLEKRSHHTRKEPDTKPFLHKTPAELTSPSLLSVMISPSFTSSFHIPHSPSLLNKVCKTHTHTNDKNLQLGNTAEKNHVTVCTNFGLPFRLICPLNFKFMRVGKHAFRLEKKR